jgi:hypothetical protein
LKFPDQPHFAMRLTGVAEDGDDTTGVSVDVDECVTVDSIFTLPSDGEPCVSLFEVNIFRIAIPRHSGGQMISRVKQPGIAGVRGEQGQGADRHKAPVVFGSKALDVTDLVSKTEVLAGDLPLTRPSFDGFPAHWSPPLG